MCRPTRCPFRGRLTRLGEMSEEYAQPLHRGSGGSMYTRKAVPTDPERLIEGTPLEKGYVYDREIWDKLGQGPRQQAQSHRESGRRTVCWRQPDSNHRSRVTRPIF